MKMKRPRSKPLRLVVRLEPLDMEGPNHYLNRLADANQYFRRDSLTASRPYGVALLSGATAAKNPGAADRLENIARHYYTVNSRVWVRNHSRCCPRCLADGCGKGTVGWELRFADACASHGCWLQDTCTCGQLLRVLRPSISRCSACSRRLASLTTTLAPDAVVRMAKLLVQKVCEPIPNSPSGNTLLVPRGPDDLTLPELTRLIQMFGDYGDPKAPQRFSGKSIELLAQSWRISSLAAEVISNWPDGFARLLDWMRTENEDGSTFRFTHRFGRLYGHLLRTARESSRFGFLDSALQSYLSKHWPSSRLRGKSLDGSAADEERAWISPSKARRLLGLSRKRLDELVESAGLVVESRTTQRGRTAMAVSRDSLERLIASGAHATITMKEATQRLGLPDECLKVLLPHFSPRAYKASGGLWRIPLADVAKVEAIERRVELRSQVRENETTLMVEMEKSGLTYPLVARLVARALTHPSELPNARLKGLSGIRSWIVDKKFADEAHSSHVRARRSSVGDDHITLPDLAIRWKVKQQIVYQLVHFSAIPIIRLKQGGYVGGVVPLDEVQKFEQKYVLARALSTELRTSPAALYWALRRYRVFPKYDPSKHCIRQRIYRRTVALVEALTSIAAEVTSQRRSAHKWQTLILSPIALRRANESGPRLDLVRSPNDSRTPHGQAGDTPSAEAIARYRFGTADRLKRAAEIGQTLAPPALARSLDLQCKSAMKYWGAWCALRFGHEIAIPVSTEVVLRFIADHIEISNPGNLSRFPALHPIVEAPRQIPREIEWLLRRHCHLPGGPWAKAHFYRRLAALSHCHDEYCEAIGDAHRRHDPVRNPSVQELLRAVAPDDHRHLNQLSRIPATLGVMNALLSSCSGDLEGSRDRAMMLVCWASQVTRVSQVLDATLEGVSASRHELELQLPSSSIKNKRGARTYIHLKGNAAEVVKGWLIQLDRAGIHTGPIFRKIRDNTIRGRMWQSDFLQLNRDRCERAGFNSLIVALICRDFGYLADCRRRAVTMIDQLKGHGVSAI